MARPYLNKTDRKRMLLDTAASIVDKHDWSALSMIICLKIFTLRRGRC
jgi:hypothetical protein